MNNHPSELGDLDTWQENANTCKEDDEAWQVLRQQKIADKGKRVAEH